MKKTTRFTILFCALGLFLVCSITAQNKSDHIQNQRITIRMDSQPLGKVFRYLMERYYIRVGFEQSILDRNHSDYSFQTNLPSVGKGKIRTGDGKVELDIEAERVFNAGDHPISINVQDVSLNEAFDQIVAQMDNYKWEINDGVINIFPIRGRDERFKELMESKVANFHLPNGQTVDAITVRIIQLPEFRAWSSKNRIHFNPARTGSSILLQAQYGRVIDNGISFSDVTFRQLLNQITKTKGGGWILKWRGGSPNETDIDLDI